MQGMGPAPDLRPFVAPPLPSAKAVLAQLAEPDLPKQGDVIEAPSSVCLIPF